MSVDHYENFPVASLLVPARLRPAVEAIYRWARAADDIADVIRRMFEARGRRMADNNLRQAMVPVGATVIPQTRGTAPGLICPVTVDRKSVV